MARVCVGCGLTTDAEENLIVAVDGSWAFACELEDGGGSIYCSDIDGILRVAPPVLATVVTNTGSFTPTLPATVISGGDVTVDTIDIDLENPSDCYSAVAFLVLEAEIDVIIPVGTTLRMQINNDQVIRYRNRGTTSSDGASWQMARGLIQVPITPGNTASLSIPIDLAPIDGDIEFTRVQWRANAIIVASQ